MALPWADIRNVRSDNGGPSAYYFMKDMMKFFKYTEEGEDLELGFNFYPKDDNRSSGFRFIFRQLFLRIRYRKRFKDLFIEFTNPSFDRILWHGRLPSETVRRYMARNWYKVVFDDAGDQGIERQWCKDTFGPENKIWRYEIDLYKSAYHLKKVIFKFKNKEDYAQFVLYNSI